jgi:hypothetical protein
MTAPRLGTLFMPFRVLWSFARAEAIHTFVGVVAAILILCAKTYLDSHWTLFRTIHNYVYGYQLRLLASEHPREDAHVVIVDVAGMEREFLPEGTKSHLLQTENGRISRAELLRLIKTIAATESGDGQTIGVPAIGIDIDLTPEVTRAPEHADYNALLEYCLSLDRGEATTENNEPIKETRVRIAIVRNSLFTDSPFGPGREKFKQLRSSMLVPDYGNDPLGEDPWILPYRFGTPATQKKNLIEGFAAALCGTPSENFTQNRNWLCQSLKGYDASHNSRPEYSVPKEFSPSAFQVDYTFLDSAKYIPIIPYRAIKFRQKDLAGKIVVIGNMNSQDDLCLRPTFDPRKYDYNLDAIPGPLCQACGIETLFRAPIRTIKEEHLWWFEIAVSGAAMLLFLIVMFIQFRDEGHQPKRREKVLVLVSRVPAAVVLFGGFFLPNLAKIIWTDFYWVILVLFVIHRFVERHLHSSFSSYFKQLFPSKHKRS